MLTMRLLWWQHLPLLILIQLVLPNSWTYKLFGEALLNFRSSFGGPQQFRCSIAKYPCQRQWRCLDCYQLKYPCAFSLGIAAKTDGNNEVPTLTPLQENQVNGPRKETVGATVGAVVAALIVIIIMVIFYICLMRVRRLAQTSETASSMPSPVELGRGNTCAPSCDAHKIRQLTILELEQATINFGESNIIGGGRFGLVYKGLLQDGSIVAIKRRLFALTQDFTHQVKQVARIHHKHLVKLVGYYEDSHQQLLVYEYLHNGNVGNHLYDNDGLPIGKLNIRQRLSIALGASKGLEHLHGLDPPLLHTHFRTSNVIVDENFTAKVSDYGFCKLQNNADRAGSSNIDCFFDPELNLSQNFSEKSDVYNFGVFLFELTSGCEALYRNQSNSEENLVFQAKNSKYLDKFLDITLTDHEKFAAMKIMELALLCLDVSFRRPSMRQIVAELEQIQRTEIAPLHSHKINVIGAVALGSELFK